MVKFGGITTGKTVGFSGKTVVKPLKSTVLPAVIPPYFTTDFHW